MERAILHLDLDSFFVSVERVHRPALLGRPVLVGADSDRGVVASCSYEARAFGIRSAMPMRTAKQLCPEAIIVRGNTAEYMRFSDMVTDIIRENVPLFEKTSVDEFYVDLTGTEKFFGSWKLANDLRERITRGTGLPNSFGLSTSKAVSKIATGTAKPNGVRRVEPGTEKAFLAPMPIERIPMVGESTARILHSMGVHRIAQLQVQPEDVLRRWLGEHGPVLWRKANGIDNAPVEPWHERKSISTERTFERDTMDQVKLRGLFIAMAENLASQLRRGGKLAACIAVKIRYADMQAHTKQMRIPYTASDHLILPAVHTLFRALYDQHRSIRLIGVRYSDLVESGHQLDVFNDTGEASGLYEALDRIRDRFGDRTVVRAAGMEARSIGRLNNDPFSGTAAPMLFANRRT